MRLLLSSIPSAFKIPAIILLHLWLFGTAIAENLDLASLQIMAASHPYRLSLLNDRILEFTFDPIILPDSISNEPASHGFIKYSIVPNAAIPIGARAYNTAYIYFDFNTPVQTNTVETTISTASNVNTPIFSL